jgi:hypothetical protein
MLYPGETFEEGDEKAMRVLHALEGNYCRAWEQVILGQGGKRAASLRGEYLGMLARLTRGMSYEQVSCISEELSAIPLDKRIDTGNKLYGYLSPDLTIAKIRDLFAGRNSLGGCGLK